MTATNMTSASKGSTPRPARVIAPGLHLLDELNARGWTQRQLAQIIDRPYQMVNEIVRGRKAITAETSQEISAALGTSPDFWFNLQVRYDFWKADTPEARRRIKSIAARARKASVRDRSDRSHANRQE